MGKKSRWGIGIVISFIIFAVSILAAVYVAVTTKVDLVSDDYYEKELKYQQHINTVQSTNDLSEKVTLSFNNSNVVISFPKIGASSQYSGTVFFFRPSDKYQDFTKEIRIDSAYTQTIPTDRLAKGMWRVKISWNVGEKQYYNEQPVMIQ